MLPTIATGNVASAIGGGYEVANSCRFAEGDSAHLSRTFGSAGNRRTFTVSFWYKTTTKITTGQSVKFGAIFDAAADGSNSDDMYFHTNRLNFSGYYGSTQFILRTTAKYRDPSAWTHFVVAFDTTQGVAANRIKMYANGTQITAFDEETYPAENFQTSYMNLDRLHNIGTLVNSDGFPLDGYLAEFCFIDGSALTPSSFGEFDEDSPTIWKPKDVSDLTFGTNGCYLDFEDSSNLGNDANGGTDWDETNLAATDQASDSPTNNFATLNPLNVPTSNGPTFSEGNTTSISSTTSGSYMWGGSSTIGMTNGKWYLEAKATVDGTYSRNVLGVTGNATDIARNNASIYAVNYGSAWYSSDGVVKINTSTGFSGSTYTTGDILSIAIDLDNLKIYYAKNGTWENSGDPTSGATGTGALSLTAVASLPDGAYFFAQTDDTSSTSPSKFEFNFGNPAFAISSGNSDGNGYGNFEYSVPSGYYSLCTKNLAEYG